MASVEVSPSSGSVHVGGILQLTATLRDASGNALSGQAVDWASSNTSAVSVAPGGVVTGVDVGVASVTAASGGKTGAATVTVPSHSLEVSREGTGKGTVTSTPAGIHCGSACFVLSGAPAHTLTVWKSGTGDGTVTSSPAGIACGADCTEDFPEGIWVTLTASASSGSRFLRWSGACTGTEDTCRVSMGTARLVMAEFGMGPHVVSTVPENGATEVDPWIETLEFRFSEPMRSCGGHSEAEGGIRT